MLCLHSKVLISINLIYVRSQKFFISLLANACCSGCRFRCLVAMIIIMIVIGFFTDFNSLRLLLILVRFEMFSCNG